LALREKLREVLRVKEPPRKVALSFAVGVFIGMSPLLGLHTILGFAVAPVLRLNTFVTIIGVYITNPWTIVPIYTFATWFGAQVLGIERVIPRIDWNDISLSRLSGEMSHLLAPFVLGTTLLGVFSAVAGYVIVYQVLRRRREAERLAGEG
jgi:hypothetical protein